MKNILLKSVVVLLVFASNSALAQLSPNSVGLHLGAIQPVGYDIADQAPAFAFYPELQIRGDLPLNKINWLIRWGYWDDRVEEPYPVMDWYTYSYSSHILSLQLAYLPEAPGLPFNVQLAAGASGHIVSKRLVGGSGWTPPEPNSRESTISFDLGFQASRPVVDPIRVVAEFRYFIWPGNPDRLFIRENRFLLAVGLALSL
jgi:hypothetical protein